MIPATELVCGYQPLSQEEARRFLQPIFFKHQSIPNPTPHFSTGSYTRCENHGLCCASPRKRGDHECIDHSDVPSTALRQAVCIGTLAIQDFINLWVTDLYSPEAQEKAKEQPGLDALEALARAVEGGFRG